MTPLALELEIGALDGDHADLQRRGEAPESTASRRPAASPRRDSVPDLLHDLEIHRPAVGLGDDQLTVHV